MTTTQKKTRGGGGIKDSAHATHGGSLTKESGLGSNKRALADTNDRMGVQNLNMKFLETQDLPNGNVSIKIRLCDMT